MWQFFPSRCNGYNNILLESGKAISSTRCNGCTAILSNLELITFCYNSYINMIWIPRLGSSISAAPDVIAFPSWFILLIFSSEWDTVAHGHVCSQWNDIECNLYVWHPVGYRVNYFQIERRVKHNLIHWKSKYLFFHNTSTCFEN